MRILCTRSAVCLSLLIVGSIFVNIRWCVAQQGAAADRVEPADYPPAPPPIPAYDESRESETADGYQTLSQGPVHEAFAAPIDGDHTDGVRVYDKAPPPPVDEQPAGDRPADQGMKWIPGYWCWSDDVGDYVWVSGLWRKVPPGRSWIPGSWSETKSGHHRWSSGYWADEEGFANDVNYLPLPPKSIDNGPSVSPPGDDSFWVPGQWEYVDGDYQWQSGYWAEPNGDWVWQPACYVSTPQGYLLVDGYWDYLPPDRGQLYAPVEFVRPVYLQPNYVYRPRYPLADSASLLLSLFVRRGYPHYYYGDFYGSASFGLGYRPWYNVGFGFGYFSPWLYNYDRSYRKSGIHFVGSMQRYEHQARANHHPEHSRHDRHTRSVSGAGPRWSPGDELKKHSGHSLDDVVRSKEVREPLHSHRPQPANSTARDFRGRNTESFGSTSLSSQQMFRGTSPGGRFSSDQGRSESLRSYRAGKPAESAGRGTRPAVSAGAMGINQNLPSRDARSMRTLNSFRSGSAESSPTTRRGPTPTLGSGPAPAMNFRSGGVPSTLPRSPTTSFDRRRSAAGFSSPGGFSGGQRGSGRGSASAPSGSPGPGRSSFGGGSGNSGFRGGAGRGGGGSRSGGAKGRGRGKK